jgi:hypothetical protein
MTKMPNETMEARTAAVVNADGVPRSWAHL